MRPVAASLVVVLFAGAGCASSGTGAPSAPDGCTQVVDAEIAFQAFRDGVANKTATQDDLAGDLKTTASKLSDAALILPERNRSDATIAADDAGRLRVALVDGGNSTVGADVSDLADKLNGLNALCT